jgi:hypothetical protein
MWINRLESWSRWTRRELRTLLFAVLFVLAPPAAAEAATVDVKAVALGGDECRYGQCEVGNRLFFSAAAGEANDVTITGGAGGLVVRDAGAPLLPRAGCVRTGERTATCAAPFVRAVELGDRDDRSSSDGRVSGGA